ncbi:hypothetical protein [Pectobacterium versatile]|uniref:hypothetical protein n=1 Tax=Pectobacterium versatile TaxID=2488639 RepID=UPI001F4423A4|nr:hypothetical protein [Pectobacterium versatile]
MSRITNNDYKLVVDFLKNYSLSSVCSNDEFLQNLKSVHKGYFSLLVFSSEINLGQHVGLNQEILNRLNEACSDIGASILLLAHGMYKQANMSLRSSIENFSKSISYLSCPDVIEDKSVFSIFEKTRSIDIFRNELLRSKYSEITSIYADLCAYTHTATISNMARISALNSIPTFEVEKCNEFIIQAKKLTSRILIIYTHIHRSRFFRFSPSNRDVVLNALSSTERRLIMEAIE